MAKAKRGPALFELLSEEDMASGGVKVPSWWSRHSQLSDLHAARAARVLEEPPPVLEPSSKPAADRNTPRPFFEVEGDRVLFSLTSVKAAGAVFIGLAALIAAYGIGSKGGDAGGYKRGFEAGRADVDDAVGDEIEALRSQPPSSHLVGALVQEGGTKSTSGGAREDRAAAPAKLPASAVPSVGWVRDLTYIVVQEFAAANEEQARHAREFLAQRGVSTELVSLNNDTSLLITKQGYSHKDPAQKRLAEQLLDKIRTIGTQYYAAGGGYRLDGYYKTLKRDNW